MCTSPPTDESHNEDHSTRSQRGGRGSNSTDAVSSVLYDATKGVGLEGTCGEVDNSGIC